MFAYISYMRKLICLLMISLNTDRKLPDKSTPCQSGLMIIRGKSANVAATNR